jgi:hypothetical protein
MPKSEDAAMSFSKQDMIDILEAVRKPVKTDEQIREERTKAQERAELAQSMRESEANRIANQRACTHMRKDGSTLAVYVTSLNFLLCQACGMVIKPVEEPELFNRLLQIAQQ